MKKKIKFFAMAFTLLFMFHCSPENTVIDESADEAVEDTDDNSNIIDSSLFQKITSNNTVTFNSSNQSLNTTSSAESIFGNDIQGWDSGIASISDNKLKIRLQAGAGTNGAMTSKINVGDGRKYRLKFNVKFEDGFDFSRGGKIGFGFFIGDGVTGGNNTQATQQNKGGSFRVMWRTDNGGSPYFIPYVYYKDMNGQFGDDFDSNRYNNITDNKWYTIRLTVFVNSHENLADGYAKMQVSSDFGNTYTKVWEKNNMRWSGNSSSSNRKVKEINFHLFRGGANSSWDGNNGTQSVYFDSLSWERLAK